LSSASVRSKPAVITVKCKCKMFGFGLYFEFIDEN